MTELFPILASFPLAAGLMYIVNRRALAPWRRNREKHWSEQARLLFPARRASSANLVAIPILFTLGAVLLWPDTRTWVFVGILALLGAYAGVVFMDHEIFPRIPMRHLFRNALINSTLRFFNWFIFLGAVLLMPPAFNSTTFEIAGGAVVLWLVWSRGVFIWLWRKFGLMTDPPERLWKIVNETAEKMEVKYRETQVLRSPLAQAYAFPAQRKLLFTERLLEILPDDELAAICAHELGHLTESWQARYGRYFGMSWVLPWMFIVPLFHTFGQGIILVPVLITVVIPRLHRRLGRKLEERADKIAKVHEANSGVYARALMRLYEDSLLPAVTAKKQITHPDLYDRVLAAGVTPDFPRPQPAKMMAWHGRIFGLAAGVLFGILLVRYFN